MVSTILGCEVTGLIACSKCLLIKSSHKDKICLRLQFLLKFPSRKRKLEKFTVHETESFLSNPDISDQLINALNTQIYYSKELIVRIENSYTPKSFENQNVSQYIEKETDILYGNRNEKNLLKYPEKWSDIGLKSRKFKEFFWAYMNGLDMEKLEKIILAALSES